MLTRSWNLVSGGTCSLCSVDVDIYARVVGRVGTCSREKVS